MGVASWLITAAGRLTSGAASRDLRLAAVVLLAAGAACGLAMGVAMAAAGRARPVMNPPPGPPPGWPQEQAPGDPGPADRVWWRAAHSPASGWDDTSEDWLRSLRGPVIQQPPPHSAE
jgi:hypothetical protein